MPGEDADHHRGDDDVGDRLHRVGPRVREDRSPASTTPAVAASSGPGRRVAQCTAAATAGTAVAESSSQATSNRLQPNPRTSAAHA